MQSIAEAYLRLPIVAAIGASWMVDRQLIAEKKWQEITQRTQAICDLVAHVNNNTG